MARQYTTPTEQLRVKGHDLTGSTQVIVTYSNKWGGKSLNITNATVTKDGDDSIVSATLTEMQTARFEADEKVFVQVNWVKSNKRYATKEAEIVWEDNLYKEALLS